MRRVEDLFGSDFPTRKERRTFNQQLHVDFERELLARTYLESKITLNRFSARIDKLKRFKLTDWLKVGPIIDH